MNDDAESARQLFEQSLEQSKKLKWQEGVIQGRNAIRRLERKQFDTQVYTSPRSDTKSGSVPSE